MAKKNYDNKEKREETSVEDIPAEEEPEVIEADEVIDAEEVIEAEEVIDMDEEAPEVDQEINKEVEMLQNQVLRLQADFQNYQNRVAREKENTVQYANESLMIKVLDVVDNFDRALASEKEHDAFFEGMILIRKQLLTALESSGLEELVSDGEAFDPNRHNAIMSEDSDTVESGHITETLQKGYMLNGKVIRPAMVKVAK